MWFLVGLRCVRLDSGQFQNRGSLNHSVSGTWTPAPELSPLTKATRAEITLETKTKCGPQQIQAWSFSGRLCVHHSIARISGYTVSHQPSGRAVLTRICDKAAAFDLVRRLLALGEIDWHADRPLENPAALDAMLAVS